LGRQAKEFGSKSGDLDMALGDVRKYIKSQPEGTQFDVGRKIITKDEALKLSDLHDAMRNKEIRDTFSLLGVENNEGVAKILIDQTNSGKLVKIPQVEVGSKIYDAVNFKSTVTGPNGKKVNLESRWIIDDSGKMRLGTVIIDRPPKQSRIPTTNPSRVNGDWVDRVAPYRRK